MAKNRRSIGVAVSARMMPGAQAAFGSKQGHLRIIRDGANAAVRRRVIAYPAGAEAAQDGRAIDEFHGSAQRIPRRAGQQASLARSACSSLCVIATPLVL
jgi:hypothetical protein